MTASRPVSTHQPQSLLAAIASRRDVHAAFQYFHLQEKLFREWHERLVQIASPTFAEFNRGAEYARMFSALGIGDTAIGDTAIGSMAIGDRTIGDVRTDTTGNVLATLTGANASADRDAPALLLCAHLDTVFPAHTPLELKRQGDRISIPGASDNGAGLTALLAVAAGMLSAKITPACNVVFAGTVGEEGEGNLLGIRTLCSRAEKPFAAVIAVDGAGSDGAVGQALGSRRFLVEITGPGGHSWSDAGRPNPIVALAHAIAALQAEPPPDNPPTTVNFATIEGGSTINSIPERVSCRVDIRSVSQEELIRQEVRLHRATEDAVLAASSAQKHRLRATIRMTGERPSGHLPEGSWLAEDLRIIDRHLQIRSRWRTASTDANIPLSLGIPAVAIGGGGSGGAAHTSEEWFDPTGRELALRRILLLLMMTCENIASRRTGGGADAVHGQAE